MRRGGLNHTHASSLLLTRSSCISAVISPAKSGRVYSTVVCTIKKIEPQQFSLYSRSHRRARPGAVMPSGAGRTKRGPQGRTRLNFIEI